VAKLDIAKTKFEIGSSSKLDYLQSQVDLNADSTTLLKQVASLRKAKVALKYQMGMKDTSDFVVGDTIKLQPVINFVSLQSLALQQNNQILAINEQKNAALAGIKIAKSYSYPTIGLFSRYNFTNTQAEAGFILINQAAGLNYGASARWNLFEGGTIRTNIANAKIYAENVDLGYEQTVQIINTQLASSYADYIANNNLINLVRENLKFAIENLDISTESYKIGKINLIDYRAAQLGYVNAYTNLFTAIYNAKNSELNLMRLSGQISKEVQ
jgi:outer membrane protein TolC